MRITLVKKILADGSACKKCNEVANRLEESGYMKFVDTVLTADERDPSSQGLQLASVLGVDRAPFFVVDHDDGRREVYTVYFKLVREVLEPLTQ